MVYVRLVLERTGKELASLPLTRLPVAGDRVVAEIDGITRLLQVQVVAHLAPPKQNGDDGPRLDGVAVVVEKHVSQPSVADVVPFLSIVRDAESGATIIPQSDEDPTPAKDD
jgi:hypothetical protein